MNELSSEVNEDALVVKCNNNSGSSGLVGVMVNGQISWFSDDAGQDKG